MIDISATYYLVGSRPSLETMLPTLQAHGLQQEWLLQEEKHSSLRIEGGHYCQSADSWLIVEECLLGLAKEHPDTKVYREESNCIDGLKMSLSCISHPDDEMLVHQFLFPCSGQEALDDGFSREEVRAELESIIAFFDACHRLVGKPSNIDDIKEELINL